MTKKPLKKKSSKGTVSRDLLSSNNLGYDKKEAINGQCHEISYFSLAIKGTMS